MSGITNFFSSMLNESISILSPKFMVFVLSVVVIYYIVPKKLQWIVLVAANTLFYICGGFEMIFYLLGSVTVAYGAGMIMKKYYALQSKESQGLERKARKPIKVKFGKKRKKILIVGIILVLLELGISKYTGFFLENLNHIFGLVGMNAINVENITKHLPTILGCSYYTLSIIAYMTDVYRGKVEAQTNYIKLYLFVSFFPHIIQGPIERYDQLAPQLLSKHKLKFENLKTGAMLIIWGMFKKYIVADRLAIGSAEIFKNYSNYDAPVILLGATIFSIQIYADWTAYCDIVSGAAEMLDIKIAKNFDRPYFSQSLPEFWRRWHISMGTFFKDYVLYPVSASKFCLKLNKNSRKLFGNNAGRIIASALPILSVWFLTGLWHGAKWNYIFWGAYQGVMIMLSVIFTPMLHNLNDKLHFKTDTFSWKLFRIFRTFGICVIGRIIFNSGSMSAVAGMFRRLTHWSADLYAITNFGLDKKEWKIAIIGMLVMLTVSVLQEKFEVRKALDRQPILIKWPLIILMIMFIIIFGVYGSNAGYTSFIYEQF